MRQVIAVLNQKGGVGKTTTAINLGAYIAKTGKSVLIVDFDPQGNATSGLGINKNELSGTIYDVLFKKMGADHAVQETGIDNLYVLPANPGLAAAEVELVSELQREQMLKEALASLSYDFILID